MFKVNQKIVYHSLPHKRLFYVKAVLSDSIVVNECWNQAGAKSFSEFPPYADIRHATPQEIAAGHRIDKSQLMQHLDKCEEEVKKWPKWKLQSVRDAFCIPDLSENESQSSLSIKQDSQDIGDDSHIENHVSPVCKMGLK